MHMSQRQAGGPPRATARHWFGLAAMAIPIFMLSTDVTVLFMAMPAIGADLAPAGSQTLWILHIGEFLAAATVITFGLLTNRVGRRRLLLIGVSVYGIASLSAAYAVSAEMLIGARGLLGIAGASFTPAGLALLRVMFRDERQFARAFAIFMASFMGGAAAGPPLGGVLLDHFWWGSVFLINVPAVLLLVVAAPFVLPSDTADASARLDVVSVILSVLMVMSLVFGLQEIAAGGLSVVPALSVAAGAVLVVLFIRRQARARHPLLDLSLFKARVFRVLVTVLFFAALSMAATDMLLAQHLQVVEGLSSLQTGLLLTAPAAAGIVGTLLTPTLQRRMRPVHVLALTLALVGVGSLAVVPLLPTGQLGTLVVVISAIMLIGSPFMTLTSQLIITSAPQERTGSATAVQDVFAGLGNASGLAFVGSMAMAIYRFRLEGGAPDELTAGQRGAAQDSVGGAAAVAGDLPAGLGAALMDAVNTAFTTATQSAYGLAGLASLVLAAVLLGWLRRTS